MRTMKVLVLVISVVFSGAAFAAGAPTQLLIAAGNNQSVPAGAAVPGPVCAQVLDAANFPVPGVMVTWGTVTGGGSITGATQMTDATGVATLGSWTLGPAPGPNSITATSG